MGDGPRRRRANAWAWIYAALFKPEDCSETDADGECDEKSTDSTISRDQSDRR